MNPENWITYERPPLGELKNLNEEEAEKILAIEFISLDKYPELVDAIQNIGNGINDLRKKFNIPENAYKNSDVRLISKELWKSLVEITGKKEDDLAFWDPLTKKCYIRFDETEYEKDRLERIYTIYAMSHELAHRELPMLEKYSFLLSEGLADFVAKESMESNVLPAIYKPEEYNERKKYVENNTIKVKGFDVKEENLIVAIETGKTKVSGYTRIPEMRFVETIQSLHPNVFKKILELSFRGEVGKVENLIKKRYGKNFSEKLKQDDVDIKELINMIGN